MLVRETVMTVGGGLSSRATGGSGGKVEAVGGEDEGRRGKLGRYFCAYCRVAVTPDSFWGLFE